MMTDRIATLTYDSPLPICQERWSCGSSEKSLISDSSASSDSHVTMTKVPYNRATGFSRLINEKTMLRDETPLDRAMEVLCPKLASAEEEAALRALHPAMDKFLKELTVKMRHNTCHVLFDEPYVLTNSEKLLWCRAVPTSDLEKDIELDVLLPIRRLPGTRIDHELGEGYATVRINVVRFEDGSAMDNFVYVRSSDGKFFSPRAVCCIQQKIMTAAVKSLEERYKGAVVVEDMTLPDKRNSFGMVVSLSEKYTSLNQDDLAEEEEKNKAKNVKRKGGDEDDDDDEDDNDENEEEDEENSKVEKEMVEEEGMEPEPEEVKFRQLRFRFITAMNYLSKERIYFIAQPYGHDRFDYKTDVWRYLYNMRENQILRPVFRADQGRRLRAMAGMVRLCAIEPDLNWVSEDHMRQIILHQIQTEVDGMAKWQRMNLSQCVREMFSALRDFIMQRNLPHYFIDGLNLLQAVDPETLTRGMVRCSMLAKSESALTRIALQASQMDWGKPDPRLAAPGEPHVVILNPPKEDKKKKKGKGKVKKK